MLDDAISLFSAGHSSFTTSARVKVLRKIVLRSSLVLAFFSAAQASIPAQTPTPVPVTTWRYDLTHAGQNTQETALTPANVTVNSFGKLFSLTVDSAVYAQPLYMPALKMKDGLVHNVVFVATENDSIYAFDADSNGGANANPIWKVSLLDAAHGAAAGATAIPSIDTGSYDVSPTVGITGTPAINPATGTMYVIGNTKENGTYYSRLHAINLLTGAEQANSPVVVTLTVAGTGDGSSGGMVTFSPLSENQRSALNYYNGYVYFGYAAHGDNRPWHGWLFAYNATTMQQSAGLCLSPNDRGAGIWGAGAGMPIDEDGPGGARMFVATGNGGLTKYPPFTASSNMSMTVLDFSLANGGLTPADGFTSYNYETINSGDYDQGSGGVLMVPDQQGAHPHIIVQVGKEGRTLVLNRDALGGYNSSGTSNSNALQDLGVNLKGGMWATPAYWNGNVYIWADNDVPKLFKLSNGVMDATPSSQSSITTEFPSPTFSISSNGAQDGIAWAVRSDQFNTSGPAILYAWNANDLTTPIYESDADSDRDDAGLANKFSVPVVTNGKVYVAANGEVDVYGLFNGEPTATAPAISPDGGTFTASQTVSLSTATPSGEIFYTLDGSTPTPFSTPYTQPITVSTDTTINAIASAPGYIQSAVSSATFAFKNQTPSVAFAPAAGTYLTAQKVTISDSDTKAKIYYSTDGSTPSASSKLYTGPISVLISETVKAIAIDASLQNSNVGVSAYVIQEGGSSINFGEGFSSTNGLTLNGSAIATNDTRLQLTTGALWQAGSVFWNSPINIQAFTTDFNFQLSVAQGNGFTFTIQNIGPTALGGDSAGLGYQNIGKSVAVKFNFYNYENEGSNSTGVYMNGAPPVLPTIDMTPSGIQLASGDAIAANITYNGTTLTLTLVDLVTNDKFTMSTAIDIPATIGGNTAYVGFTGGTGGLSASQKILNWTYATQSIRPTFTPAAGTYKTPQSVSLKSASAGTAIYYTINRTTPTAASTRYSGPIPVDASETIEAIAIGSATGASPVATVSYIIQDPASFTLAATTVKAIPQGNSTTSTITVTPGGGFTGNVALKCDIAVKPANAVDMPTCLVTQPAAIAGTKATTSKLTVKTLSATTAGAYTVTVTGVYGILVKRLNMPVTVTHPSFAVTGTPIKIASPGASATGTITITPKGGFTGVVDLKCGITTKPAGTIDLPTCSLTAPPAITGTKSVTSTLTVKTESATTRGNYSVTVTGTTKSLTGKATLALAISGSAVRPVRVPLQAPGAEAVQ